MATTNFLLVHGAGERPEVWDGWEGVAIDLQAGLNVPQASLLNYEAVVTCDADLMARPLCVVARGMGALAAMLAARRVEPEALVLVEPWPPEGSGQLEPAGQRPESELALAECRRGVSVPPLPDGTRVLELPEAGKNAVAAVIQWAR